MTQSAKAQEPSMEEILASIRRIIADDDAAKPAAPAPRPAVAAPPPRPVPKPAPPPIAVVPPPAFEPPAPPANNSQNEVDALFAASAPQPEPTADVLDLTEAMVDPEPEPENPAPAFQTIDGQSDVVFSDAPPEPREEPRRYAAAPPPAPPPPQPQQPDHGLLSSAATAAVDSAFNTLAQTVLVHNARTLEDLVREMLRPMLKTWLDDNLPGMVERLVRAEIERVSRSRGP